MHMGNRRRNVLDRDSFVLGFGVALVFPVMVYGVLLTLVDALEALLVASDVYLNLRARTVMLVAICCNLIPFHLYQRWGRDNTMRGMVIPTLAFVVYWFWMYGRHLLGL